MIKPFTNRVRCPVCNEEVYSRAGIHPQCAVRQSDPPRMSNKARKSPSPAEPVPVSPEEPAADAAPDRPPAVIRVYDPDRTPV